MSVEDKDMEFVIQTLLDSGWLKRRVDLSELNQLDRLNCWTKLGETRMKMIFESIRDKDESPEPIVPQNLKHEQVQALRWLAWKTYNPALEPPPSL
jgi:hypothetical protein